MEIKMSNDWQVQLADFFATTTWEQLNAFVAAERVEQTIYPPESAVFRAFELTPFQEVKVVIIGQDPYHGPNQANGLSFSVTDTPKLPPSLRNIFQELATDVGVKRTNPDLSDWAKQGVLLMNCILTVRAGEAGSHQNQGWEAFTETVIERLNQREEPIVFILWGKFAQQLGKKLTNPQHAIIKSAHPSPLSAYRGFFGSKPFSQVNEILNVNGEKPICW